MTLGLLVGEGMETVLSAARGFTPAWACLDAWHLKTLPVLGGLDCLTIVADHDAPNPQTGIRAGEDAAISCARRWLAAGVEVRIWSHRRTGVDFADFVAPPPSWCWSRSSRRISTPQPTATGRSGAGRTRSGKCMRCFAVATPRS